MPKLKPYIALFLFFCAANAFSQDNAWYIYLDDLESEAVEYSFGADNKGASFYIYLKNYETEIKRDSIKKAQIADRKKHPYKIGPPLPSTGVNFWASESPEKLESLNGLTLISPKEYREVKVFTKRPRETYIITKSACGGYNKWRVIDMPEQ